MQQVIGLLIKSNSKIPVQKVSRFGVIKRGCIGFRDRIQVDNGPLKFEVCNGKHGEQIFRRHVWYQYFGRRFMVVFNLIDN